MFTHILYGIAITASPGVGHYPVLDVFPPDKSGRCRPSGARMILLGVFSMGDPQERVPRPMAITFRRWAAPDSAQATTRGTQGYPASPPFPPSLTSHLLYPISVHPCPSVVQSHILAPATPSLV